MKTKLMGLMAGVALLGAAGATGCQKRGHEGRGGAEMQQQQQRPPDQAQGTGGAGREGTSNPPAAGDQRPGDGASGGTILEERIRPEVTGSESWQRNSPEHAPKGPTGYDVMQDDASPNDDADPAEVENRGGAGAEGSEMEHTKDPYFTRP